MAVPADLRSLARRRLDIIATAAATMAGVYDRKPVSRSHSIGIETVRLTEPMFGLTVSDKSQGHEAAETPLSLPDIRAAVALRPDDLREMWEELKKKHDVGQ